MIFNEIYSAYYNTVAKIIGRIIEGGATEKELEKIVSDNAFSESMLTIIPSLKSQKWQLVRKDMTTPIKHTPTMPLTQIQKEWLKALSLDPRIKLFDVDFSFLEDVKPLFTPEDLIIYDRYADGDPYEDEGYVTRFKTIMFALKNGIPLRLNTVNRRGNRIMMNVFPRRLEYSEKDDKFRLISSGCRYGKTVNLARIESCSLLNKELSFNTEEPSGQTETVTLYVKNDRNALERAMLHFAHFEKRAERSEENSYLLHINYERNDETELVIRILSFGPMVEVIHPHRFRELIIERLKRQKDLGIL